MTYALCPTCNTPLRSRHHEAVGATVLHCRCCKRYSVEGSSHWTVMGTGLIETLRVLADQVKRDRERVAAFMAAPNGSMGWESVG